MLLTNVAKDIMQHFFSQVPLLII